MPQFSHITIIYNPSSTGASDKIARKLEAQLRLGLPNVPVNLAPTERAGHATDLAYEAAKDSDNPLVISVSGDGGYHEVINGLLRAQAEGAQPVAGLVPAGNANDHYRNVHSGDFMETVLTGTPRRIDVLKAYARQDGRTLERFAHSYFGVGLSSKIGRELNRAHLNRLNEVAIVWKGLWGLNPVRLKVDGETHEYDSLICSNVRKMSKVFALSDKAQVDDGTFEVTALYRRSRLRLISALLRASTTGLVGARQTDALQFRTFKPTLVQLDGETVTIDAGTDVVVTIEPLILRCIV